MGLRDRVEQVEARISPRVSLVGQLTPEAERERMRQFRKLYRELGRPWPPTPTDPARVREELFAEIARQREAIDRKAEV